jgi:hypothetical protein
MIKKALKDSSNLIKLTDIRLRPGYGLEDYSLLVAIPDEHPTLRIASQVAIASRSHLH